MKQLGVILVTVAVALLTVLLAVFLLYTFDPWPVYPLPTAAAISDSHDPFYSTTGIERISGIETDQPLETIEAFYRDSLAGDGWRYRCTVTANDPPCGNIALQSDSSRLVVYDRGKPGTARWETFEAVIEPAQQPGWYTIQVAGFRGPQAAESPLPAVADSRLQALLGDWRSTDAATGIDFSLRFDDRGRVGVLLPFKSSAYPLGGTYQPDDQMIHLIFSTKTYRLAGVPDPCATVVSFLRDFCHDTVIPYATPDPAAYPGIYESDSPTSAPVTPIPGSGYPTPIERSGSGYPAPTPADSVESRIDAVFDVVLDGDTLTLTDRSGASQTFRRVTGAP